METENQIHQNPRTPLPGEIEVNKLVSWAANTSHLWSATVPEGLRTMVCTWNPPYQSSNNPLTGFGKDLQWLSACWDMAASFPLDFGFMFSCRFYH